LKLVILLYALNRIEGQVGYFENDFIYLFNLAVNTN